MTTPSFSAAKHLCSSDDFSKMPHLLLGCCGRREADVGGRVRDPRIRAQVADVRGVVVEVAVVIACVTAASVIGISLRGRRKEECGKVRRGRTASRNTPCHRLGGKTGFCLRCTPLLSAFALAFLRRRDLQAVQSNTTVEWHHTIPAVAAPVDLVA